MRCISCQKQGIFKTTTGLFCSSCYIRILEKRVRRHIRMNHIINPLYKIICFDDITFYFIKAIYKDANIDMEKKDKIPSVAKPKEIVLIKESLDDYIARKLYCQLNGKDLICKDPSFPSILSVLTDEELRRIADIKKLNFIPNKKDKDVYSFIQSMAEVYPESVYALYKSFLALECKTFN